MKKCLDNSGGRIRGSCGWYFSCATTTKRHLRVRHWERLPGFLSYRVQMREHVKANEPPEEIENDLESNEEEEQR